jgi:lantibiotic transport system permease protein
MALAFALNTKSEILKCRNTAAYWLTLGGSAVVPLIMTLSYVFKPDVFIPRMKANPWEAHFMQSWEAAAAFLLPMYIILVTSLVVQTEYKNNTWKQVYTTPRSYADIYFSKLLVIHLLIMGCFLLFILLTIAGGIVAGTVHSGYGFAKAIFPTMKVLNVTAQLYTSILGITAIQYWITLRFKNYILPLGIGLAMLVTGLIIMNWEKVIYFPYAYTAITYFRALEGEGKGADKVWLYSIAWFASITFIAFLDTVNRKERG